MRIASIPIIVIVALASFARAQTPAENAAAPYIEGIEALDRADYPRAVQSLTKAIAADSENASYRRARGVAYVLSESFPSAITELERAERLDANDTEARLWLAAAYRMSGDTAKGASLFTMRDLPHDYANMVYNLLAMQYWQSKYQGSYYDPATKRQVQTNAPVKKFFPEAAHEYAQRNRATGAAAAQVITAQAKDAIAKGDWDLALRDISQLRANAPEDSDLRSLWAQALIGAGNALQAREEFTRVLCVNPLWPDGYLGRAQAHLIIGDAPRAQTDLEVAASLGAGRLDDLQARLNKFAAPAPSADAVQTFESAAQSDTEFSQLVDDALAVHRLINARRERYDESYQLRIRLLAELIRDRAKVPAFPEMLARYLYNNYQIPVVWNGPRGGGEQLRPQSQFERDNELKRGIDLSDASLQIDPKYANAFATKGWILYTIKAAGVEAIADQGLTCDPDNVRLLNLKSNVLSDRASDLEAEVAGLRAGHTETHTENRSDGVYEVRTHYPPTAEELARAERLAGQAAALRLEIQKLQAHTRQVIDELNPSLLKRGGDALLAAYIHQPDRTETLVQLAAYYKEKGDTAQSGVLSLLAQPLQQTTAAPDLKTAWDACTQTKWQSASQALNRAMAIDPADARAAAYRSVIEANSDNPNPASAQRWRLAALALEEARARLSGTTLLSDKIPSLDLVDLQQSGLSLILRLQGGNAGLAQGQPSGAIPQFLENVAMEKRFPALARVDLIPTAMLPDPAGDANAVPPAPTFASLLGYSRLGLAKSYLKLGKPEEAQAQYAALRAYLANWPATDPNRDSMNVVDSYARLGQAEAAYAAHDLQKTLSIVEGMEGWPPGLPADLDARRKQLADEVHAQLGNQSWQGVQRQMNQSPAEMQKQSLEQEIAAFQKQRDTMAAGLNDPNMSARERQVRQGSMAQLDQLIAQRKAALERLQQGR